LARRPDLQPPDEPAKASDMLNKAELANLITSIAMPFVGLLLFLFGWNVTAQHVHTSLGQFPGPTEVYGQFQNLIAEHAAERQKAVDFHRRQEERNAKFVAEGKPELAKARPYTGKPTFFDQVLTSLLTVFTGFFVGSLLAIPIGIIAGLSNVTYKAINPIVQLLKPVSPLAWLPLVTMVVSAVYVSDDPWVAKSFVNSAITVTLCCLWPTLINTAVGVSSVDKNLINVGKVLNLGWFTKVRKIVLPSAVPMIFTGLRLSLGIGWMVLIAAEMLAQNPGLGKFVWDEFQNGSSNSLGRIMVAVLVIGAIGYALDRTMLTLQRFLSWDKSASLR
jgi:nitrate/nitrite transport system permease protein